eukprot:8608631-Heterocapsa_arctica.AAC.1
MDSTYSSIVAPLRVLLIVLPHGPLRGKAEGLQPTRACAPPKGGRLNRDGCLEPKWIEPK